MAGNVKLLTSAGGGVVLDTATTTATDVTVKVPVTGVNNGTLACTDANGNLGLGVTPSAWLANRTSIAVKGSAVANFNYASTIGESTYNSYWNTSGTPTYQNNGYAAIYEFNNSATGGFAWKLAPSGTAGNAISFTQAMTLDSSGNLLVGTTSAITGGTELQVVNASGSSTQIRVRHSSTTAGYHWRYGADAGNSLYIINHNSAGVYMNNGSTSWSGLSDERAKDIVEPINNAANKVATLRAVIGKYKSDEDGTRRSFLIAQDVQAVLPEAVSVANQETGYLGLSYTDIIPLLVAAIQELKAELDATKAEVDALKGAA